jgi:hypothetical protein
LREGLKPGLKIYGPGKIAINIKAACSERLSKIFFLKVAQVEFTS